MKIYARIEVFDGETGRDIVQVEASADCVSDAVNDAYELAWGKLNEDLDEPEVNEGTDWWIDEDEDEDEFSLGLIERPEPTMDDLEAQRLWDKWMASASADPRAALGVSIPQRFIVGIDRDDLFTGTLTFTPAVNEWARGIEVEWGAREPLAFTRANKQAFTDLIETTVLSNSAFDFGDPDHDFTD